jgi:uncharacterized protein
VNRDSKPIVNLTRGRVVCEHAMIADQPLRRMRGLLGRDALPPGEGLLLQPSPSIHTAFMRFPIDVVFLDRNRQVVKLVERLRPWRAASARRARATLELAIGEVAAREIQIGDTLAVLSVADELAANPRDNGSPKATAAAADPLRVLLVGKDRRFRSVAAALLTRRGCAVTLAERMASLPEVASREGTEVVVIDVGSSLTAAAREASQIQTLDPPVAVVLVREEREEGPSAIPVVEKWGSFDQLYGAIEAARPLAGRRCSNEQR